MVPHAGFAELVRSRLPMAMTRADLAVLSER